MVMSKKYMTVLLEYEPLADLPRQITQAFCDNSTINGAKIVAVSLEDEFKRIEELEELLSDSFH